MDLKAIDIPPTPEESATVDALLGPVPPEGEEPNSARVAKGRRHLLLPALHAVQARFGWISPGALGYVCRRLEVPPAEGYGVATFYAMFSMTPRAPSVAHVCDDIACKVAGADALCETLERTLGPAGEGLERAWMRSPCLGMCEKAPAALLIAAGAPPFERAWGPASAEQVLQSLTRRSIDTAPRTVIPQAGSPELRLLRRIGVVDPASLDDYRSHGGYEALRRALEMGPSDVIREVTDSKLVGRGGAAFPTGRKWDAVAKMTTRPHYVLCNADESEPGTFKDRYIMEDDPFAVIESMTIAGFATGSEQGYIYIRGEYPLAAERLQNAIERARARGLLGPDILGQGLRFDIEIRRGAGAYICGEETALMNSIEGFRGEPRNKPPFPVQSGLFRKPTAINNVETLVSVLDVLTAGASAYIALGTSGSSGTKLFCVSGTVVRPGVYEVRFGTRLDELIALAGGVPGGRRIQTVLLGGAAGAFVTPDELATPLTFEDTRKIGATLGSGVVMVFDDTIAIVPILRRIAEFFRDESCGQCVPCRVGTIRQEELMARCARGAPLGSNGSEAALLKELGQVMRDASICGLGQTASSAIESAAKKLKLFEGRQTA
ncbi:MAG TPA: NAD(P)H-dependent oxidoreductase subunit E [Thermoanaerobaculia bacterium]